MHDVRLLAGLVAASLLAGCAVRGAEVPAVPAYVQYVCQNQKTFHVVRYPDVGMATILVDTKEVQLRAVSSAVQEKYTDGYYTLYLDGEKALLEHNSTVIFGPCSPSAPPATY